MAPGCAASGAGEGHRAAGGPTKLAHGCSGNGAQSGAHAEAPWRAAALRARGRHRMLGNGVLCKSPLAARRVQQAQGSQPGWCWPFCASCASGTVMYLGRAACGAGEWYCNPLRRPVCIQATVFSMSLCFGVEWHRLWQLARMGHMTSVATSPDAHGLNCSMQGRSGWLGCKTCSASVQAAASDAEKDMACVPDAGA